MPKFSKNTFHDDIVKESNYAEAYDATKYYPNDKSEDIKIYQSWMKPLSGKIDPNRKAEIESEVDKKYEEFYKSFHHTSHLRGR